MKFSQAEKRQLLEYVSRNLTESCNIPLEVSKKMVYSSALVKKIDTSPFFIGHCSMGQLVDMVKKEKHIICTI